MEHHRGHPEFYKLLEKMADLHDRKNSNYAQDGNPFSNFEESQRLNIEPWLGVLIRMSDKWARICELAKGKSDEVGEAMEDTLMDLAVYSLICIILQSKKRKHIKTK